MQLIALKNFKSYQSQVVNNLNPHINVIIGKNGQGKSNFFKAIAFALTDRVPLNKTEYQSHLHRAIDSVPQPIGVEIYVRSKLNQQQYDQNIYRLQRIWQSEQGEEFKVDEKIFSKSQYESFVESLGLSYSNSYNILQQGKINQVVLMDEFDIYKLLEEATGIKKFQKRHEEAVGYMRKNDQQKKEIIYILKEIQGRLEVYQSRKEEFEMYSFQEKACKVKSKVEYQQLINKFNREATQLKQKQAKSSDEITKTKIKIKDFQSELEHLNAEITVNQKQMYQFFDQSAIDDDFLNVSMNFSQEEKQLSTKLKQVKSSKDKLKKELQKVTNENQKIKTQMKPYKEKYEALTTLIATEKLSKEGKEGGKEQMKKWIQKSKDNIKEIQNQLKKVTKMKSQFKIKPNSIELTQQQNKKQKLAQINNQLRANKIKYFQSSRSKNQFESQVEVLSKQMQVNYTKMRKVLPLLEFNLLNQLKKQKIQGVYGFLIEFVDILPTVLFAYEMSGLSKLCTLIVQNQDVVEAVVNINKKIKGKQINIMPLSFIKRQPNIKKSIPNIDDVYSLLNEEWIKIKRHSHGEQFTKSVQKIIINTFSSHVLVKDYDIGLKVSKEYHLNCITADKQIVYSQGYLCKVGKDMNVDDKFQLYQKYVEKNNQLEQASKRLTEVSKQFTSLQNTQMELMKRKMVVESQLKAVEMNLEIISQQKRSVNRLEEEETKLQEKKAKLQSEITRKEQILTNFDKKITNKVNLKQYSQLEETYNNKLKSYNKKSEEECQLQNRLISLAKQQQDLSEELKTINQQVSFQKEFNVSFVGGKEFKQKLQRTNDELERKKKRLQTQMFEMSQKLAQDQTQNYSFVGNLSLLEDQIGFYGSKLQEIGSLDLTMEEVEQKSNSFSVSMSRMDEKRKVRIYTTLQKLIFSKIEGYYQKYKESKAKLKELEETQTQINDMIGRFQVEKDKCVSAVFLDFEKHFENIFRAITLHGKSDVRLKKINQKTRGFLKVRNSISIMVSFEGEREVTKKWSEFSGGQKTVIAVCLLMALQKCQPAPFYILDQIDSALDPIYLQRIVDLIEQESKNSQYFITSFKRGMLEFKEEKCNYYFVESRDRVSTIKRVTQEYAQKAIDKIIEP